MGFGETCMSKTDELSEKTTIRQILMKTKKKSIVNIECRDITQNRSL